MKAQTRAEFDQYARDYFKEMSHPLRDMIDPQGHYFIELKSRILEKLVREQMDGRQSLCLVDVGTGLGLFEKYLSPSFPNIVALDLSFEMLRVAGSLNLMPGSRSGYIQGNAFHLPLRSHSADLVFMSCVMHHLEKEEIALTLAELARVCAPNGYLVFFEHNPLNPITQLVVRTTSLDRNARLVRHTRLEGLAKKAGIHILRREFFLYGTRGMDDLLQRCAPWLNQLPLGGQYALIGQKSR